MESFFTFDPLRSASHLCREKLKENVKKKKKFKYHFYIGESFLYIVTDTKKIV